MVLMTAFVTVGTGNGTAGSESRQQDEGVLELHCDVLFLLCGCSKLMESETEAALKAI
jgi:hypothetical protein